jgi:hypothetical protein
MSLTRAEGCELINAQSANRLLTERHKNAVTKILIAFGFWANI